MARIFLALAVFAMILLVANLILGLALGDLGQTVRQYTDATKHAVTQRESLTSRAEIESADETKLKAFDNLVALSQRIRPHRWLGVAAALVTVLVNCISITYFIGTSRWCLEVVEAYGLDPAFAEYSRRLKRRSFPFAILGILTVIGIIAFGAKADPGWGDLATVAQWVTPHFVAAMLGTVVIAGAFYFQVNAVGANYQIIQRILVEAERIRSQ